MIVRPSDVCSRCGNALHIVIQFGGAEKLACESGCADPAIMILSATEPSDLPPNPAKSPSE